MASYHFAVQVLGRSKGHSAVAAAAYRARGQLRDERSGKVEDYSRKEGHQRSEILLPDEAAEWLGDRERLWNHVEAMEKRSDAQLAREINMALPHELTDAQRFDLVREFAREQFVSRGMVADISWHKPVEDKGDDRRNFHAHIMLTLRKAMPNGLARVKTREWNSDAVLEGWRVAWDWHQNRALERAGHLSRVDHRTLAAQKAEAMARGDRPRAAQLDRVPEIHIGARATNAARRGYQPRSQDREVRLPRRPRKRVGMSNSRATRLVRYSAFDRGSRALWAAGIVDGNQRRFNARAERREIQLVRVRQRELRMQRTYRLLDDRLSLLTKDPRRASSGEVRALQLQRARAARHLRLCRELVKGLERLLAGLLHTRSGLLLRHQALVRGRSPQARAGGRSRMLPR